MNSDRADISIIIPIFNMADTLMQALMSLRGGEASLEIILMNDGSTDEVNRVVRDFEEEIDRKSTRLNSSHVAISYAVFCLEKKTTNRQERHGTISACHLTSRDVH